MRRAALLSVIALLASGCASAPRTPTLTTSGLSSGGYMAVQMHLAFSDRVAGAAALAAGPYDCAAGNIAQALGPCIAGPPPALTTLRGVVVARADAGEIADTVGLRGSPVWLFRGRLDAVVAESVVAQSAALYRSVGADVVFVDSVDAVHGIPTEQQGVDCETMATPFVNACGYDAAGNLLQHLSGRSGVRATTPTGEWLELAQDTTAGLSEMAVVYRPRQCTGASACDIHIAFHGCQQNRDSVADAFVREAGYAEWADGLDLIVLFPQAAAGPLNPLACWDWWGYSGSEYATRKGAQMNAVLDMVDSLLAR
ncbi:MAG: poly(3-hydroxybutyrate) depolymerase [Pseudomonadota bacterium]